MEAMAPLFWQLRVTSFGKVLWPPRALGPRHTGATLILRKTFCFSACSVEERAFAPVLGILRMWNRFVDGDEQEKGLEMTLVQGETYLSHSRVKFCWFVEK